MCSYWTSYTLLASGYYGTERVYINCTQTLSNFTAILTVQRLVNASFSSLFNTFWGGTIHEYSSSTSTQIFYIWTILSGQTISSSGFPYYF